MRRRSLSRDQSAPALLSVGGQPRRGPLQRVRTWLGPLGSVWVLAGLLAVTLLVFTGTAIGGSFAGDFSAQTIYQSSPFTAGSLTAPTGTLTATPSGNAVDLSGWAVGTNGNHQEVNGVDTTTSASCSSSNTFAPVTVTSSTATTYNDGNEGGQSVVAGDHFCYQVENSYGQTTSVTLSTALTKGQTNVTSLTLSSVPEAISSGDSILVTSATTPPTSQVFTVASGDNYAVSASATPISVVSATSNAAYSTSSSVFDTSAWTAWTSSGLYASAQVGLVTTAAAIANGGTAGKIGSGDTITLTFNQAVTKPTSTDDICTIASTTSANNAIIIGDSSHTTCSGATASDNYVVGELTLASTSTATLTTSSSFAVTYSTTGDTLTITVGTGTATTVNGTATWVFEPSTSLVSLTGSVAACQTNTNSNSLCQPTATGSF